MNAVRSLSDSMSGVFTGLSIPEINAGQLAQAGAGGGGTVSNSKTINMGGLTVNVNGCNVQNDDNLADKVRRPHQCDAELRRLGVGQIKPCIEGVYN
ncbi:MAG: hypothetical protein K5752_07275 [Succinivibrionaceae bacterium]|nr:hypothetical protein [Succinivibrionaceae bacterium]